MAVQIDPLDIFQFCVMPEAEQVISHGCRYHQDLRDRNEAQTALFLCVQKRQILPGGPILFIRFVLERVPDSRRQNHGGTELSKKSRWKSL
jgi:hypothetical protein